LDELQSGERIFISDEITSVLFPPGRPDAGAETRALAFASEHGCRIEASPKEICFVKK